ncbi:MAG TPA: hypothetical protein VG347_15385 [Verrucomicrobiae bacterium]|nr:hypothetical protein [Verrucomicrobiae bacterium]
MSFTLFLLFYLTAFKYPQYDFKILLKILLRFLKFLLGEMGIQITDGWGLFH